MSLLDMAADNHYKALSHSMQFSDKTSYRAKKNRVVSLNGLGNIYLSVRNNHLADSVLRQALAGERELGSGLGQAINYANLGAIFEDRGMTDSAMVYYEKSMEMNRSINSNTGIALCLSHFGRLYEKAGNYDKAIEEYAKAYELMKDEGDDWHWLDACIALSNVNLKKGDMVEFRRYIDKSHEIAQRIKSPDYIVSVYQLQYEYYNRLGDTRQALHYYTRADMMQDSLFNAKKLNDIENKRVNLIHTSSKAEIASAHKDTEIERQAKQAAYIAMALVALLLLTVIVLLVQLLRTRTKTQRMQKEMLDVRETFFANVTHEFRTPLMVINGLSKELTSGKTTDNKQTEYAESINRQGNNLLELVNQLLEITRVKSAIGNHDWRQGNVVPYIQMLTESYRLYANERGVLLNFLSSETDICMDVVPEYLDKIVRNLLSNALKFTPDGGHVTVALARQEQKMTITVKDSGEGISKETLPHIFEPFYRSMKESQNISTGIGLVLVKQIVDYLKGSVKVESEEGKGSTFIVTLPIKASDKLPKLEMTAIKEQKEMLREGQIPTDDKDGKMLKETVMIVEDNADSALYIGSQLSDNYNIIYASDGEAAMKKLKTVVPDLIISDVMMPNMDGFEFCAKVKSIDELSHIPVILLTARVTAHDKLAGLENGADAYIVKPFDGNELQVRVARLIEQRQLLRKKFSKSGEADKQDDYQDIEPQNRQFIAKVNDQIYLMMRNKQVNAEQLASVMCLSVSQLNRRLMTITGKNTSAYITDVRMSYAQRLLRSDLSLSITDIASKCGYEDIAYFSRMFKQNVGVTPSQYRK